MLRLHALVRQLSSPYTAVMGVAGSEAFQKLRAEQQHNGHVKSYGVASQRQLAFSSSSTVFFFKHRATAVTRHLRGLLL